MNKDIKEINQELTSVNVFIVDLINKFLKVKFTYSSFYKSNDSKVYQISIERNENQEEESIEYILLKNLIDYNEQYIQQLITYNIDLFVYETELYVYLILEYKE